MIKNLCFTLLFFLPLQVLAQTPLDKGEEAPEDGVFLTKVEAANIIVERESFKEKLKFELEEQQKRSDVICNAEKEVKDIKLSIQQEKNKDILSIKDKQIENLYKELEKESGDYSMWWFIGGATVGSVASIAIFFAATQVEKAPSLIQGN